MYRVDRLYQLTGLFACIALAFLFLALFLPDLTAARNINLYKDTISDSAPNRASNHTLSFRLDTTIAAGSYFEIVPPTGFETFGTSTFSALRNVEMIVDGTPRQVGVTQSLADDEVTITPGTPGMIRYTLNQTAGIAAGSMIELKIGNHTTNASSTIEIYDEDLMSTTTFPGDIKPILNASTEGTYTVDVRVYDGVEVANAGFLIALVERVGVGPVDTTEEVPPERFNGQPTGQLSGTTVGVEITIETNEFSICRYSLSPDVSYDAMTGLFDNTGLIYHSEVVIVTPASVNNFYVRCMDDEGNKNIDDYVITFTVNERPTGSSNTDGVVDGDGTGTGNNGGGSGTGGGGTTGSSDGEAPTLGGQSGGGGAGGGGGGGSGAGRGSEGGGGFESTDGPYRSGDGQVVITGLASPRAQITALVDGKVAETATANNAGAYSITIDAIARGAYTFGIFATDTGGSKSSTFSTSFTVTGARASALSNVNLSPSFKVTPDPVTPGQTLTISGFTIPNGVVSIENEKDKNVASRKQFTATANASGAWSVSVDTNGFTNGTYKARAKVALQPTGSSNFSNYVLYGVGQAATRALNADLNRDGKVNLTDFSILLFWWGTAGGNATPSPDINSDTRVNLTDFSILLFNWTG
jgi:hypothetical protein